MRLVLAALLALLCHITASADERVVMADAKIDFDRALYRCDSLVTLTLQDNDLAGSGELNVEVVSIPADLDGISVVLTERAGLPGSFVGTLQLRSSDPVTTGSIAVADDGLLVAYFQDPRGSNGLPVLVQDSADLDCRPPTLSGEPTITSITGNTATFDYLASEPCTSLMTLGLSCNEPISEFRTSSSTTIHHFVATGLTFTTDYAFRITLSDTAGNVAVYDAGGSCYRFSTLDTVPVGLPAALYDGSGFAWRCDANSAVVEPNHGSYSNYTTSVKFDATKAVYLRDGTIRVGPTVQDTPGLVVTRSHYATRRNESWVRTFDLFENTGNTPIDKTVSYLSYEGDYYSTTRTADGDDVIEAKDGWAYQFRNAGFRRVGYVSVVHGATQPVSASQNTAHAREYLRTFRLQIPPHGKTAIMQYTFRSPDDAAATNVATGLTFLRGGALDQLTTGSLELATNFPRLPISVEPLADTTRSWMAGTLPPAMVAYDVINDSAVAIPFRVVSSAAYLAPEPAEGILEAGARQSISLLGTEAASALASGNYSVDVDFLTTGSLSQRRSVAVTVTKSTPTFSTTLEGRDFDLRPGSTVYGSFEVRHTGDEGTLPLTVAISARPALGDDVRPVNWISFVPSTLTLNPGEMQQISITVNASGLPHGYAQDAIIRVATNAGDAEATYRLVAQEFVTISHTSLQDTNDAQGPYRVTISASATAGIADDGVELFYSVNPTDPPTYARISMVRSGSEWTAVIPGQALGSRVAYYIRATDLLGRLATAPAGAPFNFNSFLVGYPDLELEAVGELDRAALPNSLQWVRGAVKLKNVGYGDALWQAGFTNATSPTAQGSTTTQVLGEVRTPIKVLVIAADYSDARASVVNRLKEDPRIDYVEHVDSSSIPSLAALQQFDVVLAWTRNYPQNATTFGNVLADYADQGGGVVLGVFGNAGNTSIGGRFNTDDYACWTRAGLRSGRDVLGQVLIPGNPIFTGVERFDGGAYSMRPDTLTILPGADLIARWGDGSPFAARRFLPAGNAIVELGFYPVGDDRGEYGWNRLTDGGKILANAVYYASRQGRNWLTPANPVGVIGGGKEVLLTLGYDTQGIGEPFVDTGTFMIKNLSYPSDVTSLPVGIAVQENNPPSQASFPLESGTDGWAFYRLESYFTAPSFSSEHGAVSITGTNNINNYGYFESPLIEITAAMQPVAPGIVPIVGVTGGSSLYKATAFVRSSTGDDSRTAHFRLRHNSSDQQQAEVLAVDSPWFAHGFSPNGLSRPYSLYFTPGRNLQQFRLTFDFLNFDPADELNSTLSIDYIDVKRIDREGDAAPRLDYVADLTNAEEAAQWSYIGLPGVFTEPEVRERTSAGLIFQGSQTTSETLPVFTYGIWERSLEGLVTMEPDRVYQVKYFVASATEAGTEPDTPSFRLRVNSTSFRVASFQETHSFGDSSFVPQAGETAEYPLYLYGDASLAGDSLLLAFEYYLLSGFGGNSALPVVLNRVEVSSWPVEDSAPPPPGLPPVFVESR